MRRAWYDKRRKPTGDGWYHFCKWYDEQGHQKARSFPTKAQAEQFRADLMHRMNRGECVDPVGRPWDDLVEEYLKYHRTVKGSADGTVISAGDTLRVFRSACGPVLSTTLSHRHLSQFVAQRREKRIKPATINRNLRELRAFLGWCEKEGYLGSPARQIRWDELWQADSGRPVRIAELDELTRLLQAARDLYGACWYVRIILAMTTGLRRRDIERIRISDINLETGTMPTMNAKAHKRFERRPIHPLALKVLAEYIPTLPAGSDVLLPDVWHDSKWKRIKDKAGVKNLMYHDLRKSFASYLLLAGYSTAVVQDLLEHSTPNLTHDLYSKLNQIFPKAVASFPLEQIIAPLVPSPPAETAKPECPPDDTEPHADQTG